MRQVDCSSPAGPRVRRGALTVVLVHALMLPLITHEISASDGATGWGLRAEEEARTRGRAAHSCVLAMRGGLDSSLGGDAAQVKQALSGTALHSSSVPLGLAASDDSLVLAGGGQNDRNDQSRRGGAPANPPTRPKSVRIPTNPGHPAHGGDLPYPLPAQLLRYTEPLPIPVDATGPDADYFRALQKRWMGEELEKNEYHVGRSSKANPNGDVDNNDEIDGGSWMSRMEEAQANIKPPPDSQYSSQKLFEDEPEMYFPDNPTEELWWSCVEGNPEATRAALEMGAQITFNHSKYHQRTALHYAAAVAEGDEEQIVLLIRAGADVNAEDEVGCRPLHFAAETWDPDKVRALVEAGAERHHKNSHGYTPFQVARMMYDACKEPGLEPNPDYDPNWEIEMMDLLRFEGATEYPVHWPLHSTEIAALEKQAREQDFEKGQEREKEKGGGKEKEKGGMKKRPRLDLSPFE